MISPLIILDANRAEVSRQTYIRADPRQFNFYNFAPPCKAAMSESKASPRRTTSDGYLSLAEVEVIAPIRTLR